MLKFNKRSVEKVISYGFVGVIGTVVHFSTMVGMVELLEADPVFSSLVGFILTVVLSFFLNKKYTFKSTSRDSTKLFVKYSMVSVIGFLLNFVIMYTTVHILTLHYSIGQIIVVIGIPITNFLLNNYWTFQTENG